MIVNAVEYATQTVTGDLFSLAKQEYGKAKKAGLQALIDEAKQRMQTAEAPAKKATAPPKETCTEEIHGIEVMELDEAVEALWAKGIYAESGMGCTGPVLMINDGRAEAAYAVLREKGYIR